MAEVTIDILPPNSDFLRDRPVAVGNILSDLFEMNRVLSSLDPDDSKLVMRTVAGLQYMDSARGL